MVKLFLLACDIYAQCAIVLGAMWLNVYCDNTCSELILCAGFFWKKLMLYCLDDSHCLLMMAFETGFVVVVYAWFLIKAIKTCAHVKVRESPLV